MLEWGTATPHCIELMISQVRAALEHALDKELAPLDISVSQFSVLAALASKEPDSPSRLCRMMSYDPGAMTRMVDRLERKGLIQRVACRGDRRKLILELTPKGKTLVPILREHAARVQRRFRRGFTEDEMRAFECFLERALANA